MGLWWKDNGCDAFFPNTQLKWHIGDQIKIQSEFVNWFLISDSLINKPGKLTWNMAASLLNHCNSLEPIQIHISPSDSSEMSPHSQNIHCTKQYWLFRLILPLLTPTEHHAINYYFPLFFFCFVASDKFEALYFFQRLLFTLHASH